MNNKIKDYIGTYTTGLSKGIYKFDFDEDKGKIDEISLACEVSNPTYLTINKDKNKIYSVVKEISDDETIYGGVASFNINDNYKDFNATAAIRITSNGKYLYCSNRGHNSVVAYEINCDGSLKLIDFYPTYGDEPRDFNLSPNENYLIIGNNKSNNITIYKRLINGQLSLIKNNIKVPSPVCITFI